MNKKWLHWLNIALMGVILLALFTAGILAWLRPFAIEPKPAEKVSQKLPKGAFEQPSEAYKHLNEGLLKIKTEAPAIQLPNLRTVLTYYGKNSRPDADPGKPVMHFSLNAGKEPTSVRPGEPLYLVYDRASAPAKYIFSPGNTPTPLWLEATPQGNQALIDLFLKNEQGALVRRPRANAQFSLPEKEYARYGGPTWDLDSKFRVDGTLLVRQKARWYGQDRFLEKHGGAEYPNIQNKQRIDFGEGDESYSVFVDENSCLIWKDGRWQVTTPGGDTLAYSLMCVRKVDPRLINFDLWDTSGRSKFSLNLLKTTDIPPPKGIQQAIKFIGARTLSQFLFEVSGKRMVLTPHEWLILKDNQWQLLRDPKDIQLYVDRKLIAPLFVFDEIARKDDRQVLIGTLYNASRAEALEVEIPLLSSGTTTQSAKKASSASKSPLKGVPPPAGAPAAPTPAPAPAGTPAPPPPPTASGGKGAQNVVNVAPKPPPGASSDDDEDEDDLED